MPTCHTLLVGGCASAAGKSARPAARASASPISRMMTEVALRESVDGDRLDLAQTREHFVREQPDALLGLRVGHEARAADQAQVAEAADLVVELRDLLVDAVGI